MISRTLLLVFRKMKKSIKIGLLDSGATKGHAAMIGTVIDGWKSDFSNYDDLTGHGTACAYIIQKMMPSSQIYNVKIFDDTRTTSPKLVVEGIRWCLENGMDIINLSLSIPEIDYYYEFERVCREAIEKNVIIVAAADNLGRACLPAYLDIVFGVGAASFESDYDFFYRPDHPIQLYAKGDSQKVADHKGLFKYEQGTSLAAAHITAIIASLISETDRGNDLDLQLVKEQLKTRALPFEEKRILIVNEDFDFNENTKKLIIKNELSERIELIDKAVVVGSSFEVQLFCDYEDLLAFDLVGVVESHHDSFSNSPMWLALKNALGGALAITEKVNSNTNYENLFTAVMDLLSRADTLVLGHVEAQDENFATKLLSETIDSGKNVFSLVPLRKLPKTFFGDYIHRQNSPWISWPHVDEDRLSKQLKAISNTHILNSQILVLGIVHISEQRIGKFNIELMLRQQLLKRDHKIRQIGSSPYSELFSCDYSHYNNYFSPSFPTDLQMAYSKSILETINNLYSETDLIIVSCDQAISPKSFVSNNFFCTHSLSTMAFLFGMQPDGFIVVVNEMDDCEYVYRNINTLKNMFMTDVFFVIHNSLLGYSKPMGFNTDAFFAGHVKDGISKIQEVLDCPVFDAHEANSRDMMASHIIRYFDL